MTDSPVPTRAEALAGLTADALALHRSLRAGHPADTHTLTSWITDTHVLTRTALLLFRDLTRPRQHSAEDLLRLDRVAQIAKAAQHAGAELTAALAQVVDGERRRSRSSAAGPVVLIGPSPQQHLTSAAELLDRIPTLFHALHHAPDTTALQAVLQTTGVDVDEQQLRLVDGPPSCTCREDAQSPARSVELAA
ncbi:MULTISPECIES: hypothetical protein [Streptomyces]|uniref:Uncharacterized protein n=1 Tax=Streptomyces ramulosus TaxID=47762 RepID=A0ABW1FW57_9ACTN